MKNKFKIGFFGDEVWAHNCLRFLLNDKSLDIKFICGRYKTKDKKLKRLLKKTRLNFIKKKILITLNF